MDAGRLDPDRRRRPARLGYAYSSDEAADQMSVISRDEIRVVATIPMGRASKPHHLMASPNGS